MAKRGRPSQFATDEEREAYIKKYNANYYEKNKEKINKDKFARWRADSAYRKKITDRAATWNGKYNRERYRRWRNLYLSFVRFSIYNNEEILVISTCGAGFFFGVATITATRWVEQGLLPGISDKTGRRWIFYETLLDLLKIAKEFLPALDAEHNSKQRAWLIRGFLEVKKEERDARETREKTKEDRANRSAGSTSGI